MICKPNKWGDNSYGGYLFNEEEKKDIITGSKMHKHKMENRNKLYDTINILNSIEFKINNKLLEFLLNEGNYLLTDINKNDEFQKLMIIKIAEAYNNCNKPFYLPCLTDWRGRIYTDPFFIDYQGSDLSLSLLNFWIGQILNSKGKDYLYIYGANIHNENSISKKSFQKRIEWTKNNYNKIINLNKELILSADNPFVFAAFFINMKDLHNEPNTIIYTPIFLDATVNGMQHISALLQDFELGTEVNLNSFDITKEPKDLYTKLLKPINDAINEYGLKNINYYKLRYVEFNRKIIKQSIMTKVYNVLIYGIQKQLESKLVLLNNMLLNSGIDKDQIKDILNSDSSKEKIQLIINKQICNNLKSEDRWSFISPAKDNSVVLLSRKDLRKIAEIINQQIFYIYPSLNNIYKYLIEMSELIIQLGLPLYWFTPTGIKITQNYLKSKTTSVGLSSWVRKKTLVLKQWTNIINKSKQTQAIIPNIIHSLDSSHLINVLNNCNNNNIKPIITVHDCWGTLPNNMDILEFCVKK
jgi:DNA-directed RNA polymerase, mitochondrial